MTFYLAGDTYYRRFFSEEWSKDLKVDMLISYAYIRNDTLEFKSHCRKFILDSGAFTFFSKAKDKMNWEEYADRYANFIKSNNIQDFFELDIDCLVGYDKVIQLRNRIEKSVGRQSIPVWHISRGKEKFVRMCEEYPYVAFGGILTDGKSTQEIEPFFPWFINTAHKNNARIHGLGYTKTPMLHKLHFDSVDSSSWTCGNRFAALHKFDRKTGTMKFIRPGSEFRIKDAYGLCKHNFNEWVKFQEYARHHL